LKRRPEARRLRGMEAIPILIVIFGFVASIVLGPGVLKRRHELKLKALENEKERRARDRKALSSEKRKLEERVEHLESIVTSVEFELNARLNRIATRQLMALPDGKNPSVAALPSDVESGDAADDGIADTLASEGFSARFYTGELDAGTRVADRYQIEAVIGTGGMGAVYRARDETLDETVALKIVRDAHLASPELLARFRREVTVARKIQHPNVVRIHDLSEADGVMFMTMEHVDGTTLRGLMEREGRLGPARLAPLLRQALDALQAAHTAGVIHRDIKPENMLVNAGGQVKLIDFGIAQLDTLSGLTATRAVLGTPEYMAPEQIRGAAVDARADLYALGVIAFEALAGRPPFTGESPIAIGFAHCSDPVPALTELMDIDESWSAFVERAMQKDPVERFAGSPSEG